MSISEEGIVLGRAQVDTVRAFLAGSENRSVSFGHADDGRSNWFILERLDGVNALYLPSVDQLWKFKGAVIRTAGSESRLYFQFDGYDLGIPLDGTVPADAIDGFRDAELDRCWTDRATMQGFGSYESLPQGRPVDFYASKCLEFGYVPDTDDEEADDGVYVLPIGPAVKAKTIPDIGYDTLSVEGIFADVDYDYAEDLGLPCGGLTFGLDGGFELFVRAYTEEER